MRKLLLSLLLAGVAAAPAFADPDRHDRQDNQPRAERQAEREARQEARSERAVQAERPHFNGGNFSGNGNGGGQQQFDRSERFQQNIQQGGDDRAAQIEQFRARMRDGNGSGGDGRHGWQGRSGFQGQVVTDGSLRQQDRPLPQVMQRRDRSPMVGDMSRQDSQRWQRDGSWNRSQVSWNRDWRNDRRYDWRRYRNHHRSIFHLGIYYDPFGYNYQPFGIGYQLFPAYYGQRYWIDPGMYELPYPPPGTRWVRYWNDALLVDMYTGQVIDVIQDFFW